MAVQQTALVSDESALEACTCSQLCAIQIDNLYLFIDNFYHATVFESGRTLQAHTIMYVL